MRAIVWSSVSLAVAGCESSPATVSEAPAQPAALVDVPPAPAEEVAAAAIITGTTMLRKQATADKKIEVDGKKQGNWLATLYRGERVTLLGGGEDWEKVRASDDTEGYIRAGSTLTADARAATVLEPTKTFKRPDLVALHKDTLEPGTLVFILESPSEFLLVNTRGKVTRWVQRGSLVQEEAEVAAARIVARARALEADQNAEEAKAFWQLAEERHDRTKLMRVLTGKSLEDAGGAHSGDPALDEFARGFATAFELHKWDEVLTYFSPHHKRDQHDDFLEGRTGQFLIEATNLSRACEHYTQGDNAMKCLNQAVNARILEIKAPVGAGENVMGTVRFSIRPKDGADAIEFELMLEKLKRPKDHPYGLVGAVG